MINDLVDWLDRPPGVGCFPLLAMGVGVVGTVSHLAGFCFFTFLFFPIFVTLSYCVSMTKKCVSIAYSDVNKLFDKPDFIRYTPKRGQG